MVLYQGAIANALASFVGSYPWYFVFNFLQEATPMALALPLTLALALTVTLTLTLTRRPSPWRQPASSG